MTPLFLVAAGILVAGQNRKANGRARKQRKKQQQHPIARGVGRQRRPVGKKATGPRPAYARKGNGKIKQQWTSFPWQPDRVTQVAQELLLKGEKDPDRLTTAVAKTIYPVHPISGMGFDWSSLREGPERDVGAQMIWERIRLRVNTLVAADEEAIADAATVHAPPPEPAPEPEPQLARDIADALESSEEEQDEDEEEGDESEADDDDAGEEEPVSPRIGRAAPAPVMEQLPVPVAPRRRSLTLSRKRVMQRRPRVDPYALHPEDNRLGDGLYHTVQDRETIHDIAVGVLKALLPEPTIEQLANYVSLIVCSPANNLPTVWDDDHELPGASPYPWGADRPTIWLPKLNEAKAQQGVITTLGVTWPDGSNGITPPPEMIPRD